MILENAEAYHVMSTDASRTLLSAYTAAHKAIGGKSGLVTGADKKLARIVLQVGDLRIRNGRSLTSARDSGEVTNAAIRSYLAMRAVAKGVLKRW